LPSRCCTGRLGGRPRVGWCGGEPSIVEGRLLPLLPPTNNDAERALRHAVIARRIAFGTRTDEGSRFYAAGLSVIDTCRKRGVDPWTYARDLIAAARKGSALPSIPAKLAT